MTDRVKGFTVILEEDIRIDDVTGIEQSIGMIKGVLDVTPVISDGREEITVLRIKTQIRDKLYDFIVENL